MSRRLLIPLACAVVALASAVAGVVASLHWQAWDTTALVRCTTSCRSRSSRSATTRRSGCDKIGLLRRRLLLRDRARPRRDRRGASAAGREAPYYWGHPATAGSPGSRARRTARRRFPTRCSPSACSSIFVAGAAASLLAQAVGWSSWGGLVVALNPGLVIAVNHDTSEALGAALLLLGLVAYVRVAAAGRSACLPRSAS